MLEFIWNNLDENSKNAIGQVFGLFLKAYLSFNSEINTNKLILSNYYSTEKIDTIVDNLYSGFVLSQELPLVKNVVDVIKRIGMDKNQYFMNSLNEIGINI